MRHMDVFEMSESDAVLRITSNDEPNALKIDQCRVKAHKMIQSKEDTNNN